MGNPVYRPLIGRRRDEGGITEEDEGEGLVKEEKVGGDEIYAGKGWVVLGMRGGSVANLGPSLMKWADMEWSAVNAEDRKSVGIGLR